MCMCTHVVIVYVCLEGKCVCMLTISRIHGKGVCVCVCPPFQGLVARDERVSMWYLGMVGNEGCWSMHTHNFTASVCAWGEPLFMYESLYPHDPPSKR